jgi:glycosyltransferase involved in cell wall biosynthesis
LKICFFVDARSPIARNWVNYFIERGNEVHVISSYPCSPDAIPGAKLHQFPIAFSGFSRIEHDGRVGSGKQLSLLTRGLARLRTGALSRLLTTARFWLSPLELRRHTNKLRELLSQIDPDIVHAMRIPFEGMLAAEAAPAGMPLLISVWGNDFTLCANHNLLMARQTKRAMKRADALHCDCRRDLDLAFSVWGFRSNKPTIVLPGAGGIQTSLLHPQEPHSILMRRLSIPEGAPAVFNPRGFRGYVRNDIFFKAIPQVLRQYPEAVFICTGMQGNPTAEKWVSQMAIHRNVRLLPPVSRKEMADLFHISCIAVSPSLHDGTPNTLLEAMACGCFPVAGNIESVREWITDGINGLLCDPNDSDSLARAIIRALQDKQLRNAAREQNFQLIAERAEYNEVMRQAEEFYLQIVLQKPSPIEV